MDSGVLGRVLQPGDTLFRQGDPGDSMFVIQDGRLEVVVTQSGVSVKLADRGPGDFVGEMAIFEREVRMATVRALEPSRVLTVDKKNLMRRVHEDPSLAFRLIQSLSHRVRELSEEVARLKGA